MNGLTIREEKIANAFIELEGNLSAIAATLGISLSTVNKHLDRPEVFFYIQEIRAGLAKSSGMTRERLVDELSAIATLNVADFLTHDGNTLTVKCMDDLPRELLRCVSEVIQLDTATGPAIKLKFHDKMLAIDKLNKMLGHYQESQVNVKHTFVLRTPHVAKSTKAWLTDNAEPAPPMIDVTPNPVPVDDSP